MHTLLQISFCEKVGVGQQARERICSFRNKSSCVRACKVWDSVCGTSQVTEIFTIKDLGLGRFLLPSSSSSESL